jgi:hypothetical protein
MVSPKNNRLRNMEVVRLQATKDLEMEEEEKKVWITMDRLPRQTTFSSIKRMFGESVYVSATRFQIGKGNDDSSIIV